MKKNRLIGTALALTLTVGSVFAGGIASFADEMKASCDVNTYDITCEMSLNELYGDVLNADELKLLEAAEKELSALYEGVDENTTDAEMQALFDKEEAIFTKYANVYDKLSQVYDEEMALAEDEYYNSFVEEGILTAEELVQLKEADDKVDALYAEVDENITDVQLDALFAKENAIYKQYTGIYDKINAFYESMVEEDLNDYYDELVEEGILTKDELAQLKVVDEKINALYDNLGSNVSEADFDKLLEKEAAIYKQYKALFDKIDAFYDDDMMLYDEVK